MLLNLHSYYSLRYGTHSLEELIAGMIRNGYDTAVLTDINNSTGIIDFVRLATEAGLNPLAGIDFRNGDESLYIGIARNNEGFRELNEFLTRHNHSKSPLPASAPEFNHCFVIYPFGSRTAEKLKENEFIGIRPADLNRFRTASSALQERAVILSPVSFPKKDYPLHRELRAINKNILISQLRPEEIAPLSEQFVPKSHLLKVYSDFPKVIANTRRLLSECRFDFDFTTVKNKETFTDSRADDRALLRKYTLEGLERRYAPGDEIAKQRVMHELDIIHNLDFSGYFLITDDICRYARSRNFEYVGRGSGANSVVAYCLGITNVCPIELNLYFERFLNPKRQTPPDFDVDFSWDQRDAMYDYIFTRYGSQKTALMGAMTTFREKSIIRELGKIYGLPKNDIDRLVRDPGHAMNQHQTAKIILDHFDRLKHFPNQRTSHASGVLISELPLTYYSALDYPPKGLPVMQFDMYTAEDAGFEKFDILSQRAIGHIKEGREIVKANTGDIVPTDDPRTLLKDPNIAVQLKSADTIGCFYIESPAMRQLLTKLRCDDYLTLVSASSIIRPGVASSGMMKTFIERHLDPSKAVYPHPIFEEQLKETYGVMVYQEDVMKIGHHYGGLDLAEADVLRRMMSGKYRSKKHLVEIEDKYFSHCKKMGYPEETSREIWRQIESFASYSFNKAHSASFAVESYQSLYLKTYYPREFMVAVLNNYGGFYSRKVYVNEARKAGAEIRLPDVNKSGVKSVIYGKEIYLGFDGIQGLETDTGARIVKEREENGDYVGLEDFLLRTGTGLEQTVLLIRCAAFRFTGINKKELLWEAHLLLSKNQVREPGPSLFRFHTEKPALPKLETSVVEDFYDEIELLGFPVSGSLFDLAKSDFRGDATAKTLLEHEGKTIRMVGEFVAQKKVHTRTGPIMKFGTFFDAAGDFFDTVHFPDSLKRYPLRGNGIYLLEGKITVDFGCPSMEVIRCAKMSLKKDPRSV